MTQILQPKVCEGESQVNDSGTGGSTPRDAVMDFHDAGMDINKDEKVQRDEGEMGCEILIH
jgi:hypothetical protein